MSTLTQEEIDALMNGTATAGEETESELSQENKDIIGEVGNISMSQAATTLSSLLNRQVKITTPSVSVISFESLIDKWTVPQVTTSIKFKEGLTGHNILMISVKDAVVIADLMMGNDGEEVADKEFGELELSAVGEAMNQMIGSASTSMATMLDRKIDIFPPDVTKWDNKETGLSDEIQNSDSFCQIEFNLTVEGVIDSQIMQLFPIDTVVEISDILLNDKAEVLPGREKQSAPAVEIPAEVTQDEMVSISKPAFQELGESQPSTAPRNLDLIMDVPLDFSVVLGKSRKTIKDVLNLTTGSVVELDKMTDEPLEVYVNGKLIAEGEVVVINESFGIRITNILSKEQRIRHLK